jgi:hypothetical protein
VGGYASQAHFYRKFLTIKISYFRDKRVAYLGFLLELDFFCGEGLLPTSHSPRRMWVLLDGNAELAADYPHAAPAEGQFGLARAYGAQADGGERTPTTGNPPDASHSRAPAQAPPPLSD